MSLLPGTLSRNDESHKGRTALPHFLACFEGTHLTSRLESYKAVSPSIHRNKATVSMKRKREASKNCAGEAPEGDSYQDQSALCNAANLNRSSGFLSSEIPTRSMNC